MAFTTGPDFLSGILGASNSTDVLNKFKSDTGQEDFYQGLRNRYGERIGEDGYLIGGAGTMDFIDSDRDGIDDRHQAGPGQPKAGSNPDGNPIFGGGDGNPPPLGGGNNADARQAARDAAMQDSYDMNPDGTISQYDASTGETTTYNYNDEGLSFPQQFFGTAMTAANMIPTTGSLVSGIIKSLGSTAYDKFIDPVDQAIANAFGFNPEEGEYDNSAAAAALSLLGPTSYEANQAAAIENSLANLAYKEQINSLAEVDPALRERLTSFGDDLSIDNYNTALSEVTPTDFDNLNLSLTTPNPLAAYQAANSTNSLGNTAAEQDAINNAVSTGAGIGYGQNEDGDFAGLVTNPQYDGEGNMVSNDPVTTGYNETMANAIQNPAAVAAIAGNQGGNNNTGLGAMQESYGSIAAGLAAQAARNRARRDKQGGSTGGSTGGTTGGTSNGSVGGCFIKGTMIEMADGTEKEITSIKVGEETKGGTVQAKMEYMPHNIYDYKGVKVSGSHWVMEDGQFTEVENSKHGVLTDMIEPVYNFMTSKHRIFIKGVEFGGFYSQDPYYYEPYFKQEKIKINKELSEKTT